MGDTMREGGGRMEFNLGKRIYQLKIRFYGQLVRCACAVSVCVCVSICMIVNRYARPKRLRSAKAVR